MFISFGESLGAQQQMLANLSGLLQREKKAAIEAANESITANEGTVQPVSSLRHIADMESNSLQVLNFLEKMALSGETDSNLPVYQLMSRRPVSNGRYEYR